MAFRADGKRVRNADPMYTVAKERLKEGIVIKKGKKVFHKFIA